MISLNDIRCLTDDFMEIWALAHQDHPILAGAPGQDLWTWALARMRADLEEALARYRAQRQTAWRKSYGIKMGLE